MFFREFLLKSLLQVVVELIGRNSLQDIISDPVGFDCAIVEGALHPLRLSDESQVRVSGLKAFECIDQLVSWFVVQAGVEEHVVLVWSTVPQTVGHEAVSGCENCSIRILCCQLLGISVSAS